MITRSLLSIIMVVAATFGAAATDLFHIEDFNIEPGQTAQVEILLDNEVQYTAFQSDLYLPEGLVLEAQSVALTDRKADHSIATSVLADGGDQITGSRIDDTHDVNSANPPAGYSFRESAVIPTLYTS